MTMDWNLRADLNTKIQNSLCNQSVAWQGNKLTLAALNAAKAKLKDDEGKKRREQAADAIALIKSKRNKIDKLSREIAELERTEIHPRQLNSYSFELKDEPELPTDLREKFKEAESIRANLSNQIKGKADDIMLAIMLADKKSALAVLKEHGISLVN